MDSPIDEALLSVRENLDYYCSPWCAQTASLVRPLLGGLTNKSYLLESQGSYYVLRVNASNSKQLELDRRAETGIIQSVAKAGIAAELVYADPAEKFLVTHFVDGVKWGKGSLHLGDNMSRLAELLKTIHQVEAIDRVMDVRSKSEQYWQALDDSRLLGKELRLIEQKVLPYIVMSENEHRVACLCHNDLLPDNLIVSSDNQLVAIDWEYAAMGDPFFDLAVVAEGHELTPFFERQLLRDYLARSPSIAELTRLHNCRIEYAYLTLLWYAVQLSSSSVGVTSEMVGARLSHLEHLLVIG